MKDRTLPFLRWAGGKRWIASAVAPVLTEVLHRCYFEPFVGAGALFFALQPRNAVLSDLNETLIDVYRQVKLHPGLLEERLAEIPVNERTYYKVRASGPHSKLERALTFIYLNRTCFGGLYRTNKGGHFNVPYGGGSRTPEVVCKNHLLLRAARLLRRPGIRLMAGDFGAAFARAGEGDVVFCDPTYQEAGRGRFDRYGPIIFSWADQKRLAAACIAASRRGAVVVIMNADHPDVLNLYPGAILRCTVSRRKTIGNRPNDESRHREVIAVLDPFERRSVWNNLTEHLARYIVSMRSQFAGAA